MRHVRIAIAAGICIWACVTATVVGDGMALAAKHGSVWSSNDVRNGYISKTASSGIVQGNGDFKAVSGPGEKGITVHLLKNDFWRLQTGYGNTCPKVGGLLTIASPQLDHAEFSAKQSLADGTACLQLKSKGRTLQVDCVLFATENILMLTLSAAGRAVDVTVELKHIRDKTADHAQGKEEDIHWLTKTYTHDVDIPTSVAIGMAVQEGTTFTLTPDESVQVLCSLVSRFEHADEKQAALGLLKTVDVAALEEAHTGWWNTYWEKSWVRIPSLPIIEKHYYQSLYGMGAASRDPDFPPGIFGWETTDTSGWHGDYHLNYNHFAPFYALYSANRIEQADPQDGPMLDFMARARDYAKVVHNKRGVLMPVGIGPKGMDSTLVGPGSRYYNNRKHSEPYRNQRNILVYGQKSNSAYAAVNFIQRWHTTRDLDYARQRAYPLVLAVVDYWEDHLAFEKDRYVIYRDSIHEGSGDNVNPILSLGLVRNTFKAALDMSDALRVDRDRRSKWRHILEHMSAWPVQTMNGRTVFRYTEKGVAWWRDNTLGIQHIYPANAITLDSDPVLLRIARNTALVRNAWQDFNGTNSFYPACVRLGMDPHLILEHLDAYAKHTRPNGMQAGNPHGIENFSTTPNTINMMMCMSVDYILRIFPVWPKEYDAEFRYVRTWGAFLVSGALKEGDVQPVEIYSEKGYPCTLVNPWPGTKVQVKRNGESAEVLDGERFTFKTSPNETITLEQKL